MFVRKTQDCPLEELDLLTPRYLTPYLQFISDNQRLYLTHLKRGGSLPLEVLYASLRTHVFDPVLDRYDVAEQDRDYYLAYTMRGCIAIVEEWVRRGCEDPIDHVVEIVQACRRPLN